ncbi:MAG TPA: YsnF/AvaK domain-containing protein [Tepidisphaeraceae bacterium]|nr:YsnF/AvaK domain-containing protein [Tepidisphaeraceae bacterium]
MASDKRDTRGKDTNPDPITGAPGSHPVGTGIGAAGAGAAGAAIGSMAGPVGTVIGAVAGAVAGGFAGKGVAEMVDPTAEDAYWRENYKTRPYVQKGASYDTYAPAYRYGVESSQKFKGRQFDEVEVDLRKNWETTHGRSGMAWDSAKDAVRDAWTRVSSGATQTRTLNEGQETIPVVEEELRVGKREVERGGSVRVETRVEERPVQEQVNLREEHVSVERRPVNRPATPADINKAGTTIEARERSEEAVIEKTPRVVEEVVVGKEATERSETIRDTVRRTDVEVQQDETTEQQKLYRADEGTSGQSGNFRNA